MSKDHLLHFCECLKMSIKKSKKFFFFLNYNKQNKKAELYNSILPLGKNEERGKILLRGKISSI